MRPGDSGAVLTRSVTHKLFVVVTLRFINSKPRNMPRPFSKLDSNRAVFNPGKKKVSIWKPIPRLSPLLWQFLPGFLHTNLHPLTR